MNHGFVGKETFEVVAKKGLKDITTVQDYITFILKIPLISSLFKVKYQYNSDTFMISLLMTLECFQCYTTSINVNDALCSTLEIVEHNIGVMPEHDTLKVPGKNIYDGTSNDYVTCEEISVMQDMNDFTNNDATNNDFLLGTAESEIHNTTNAVDSEFIELMYSNAFHLAYCGNLGKPLAPPLERRTRQKKTKQSYLLCEFQNIEDKTIFMKWLSKVDSIKVS
jgi:hypothetical protein